MTKRRDRCQLHCNDLAPAAWFVVAAKQKRIKNLNLAAVEELAKKKQFAIIRFGRAWKCKRCPDCRKTLNYMEWVKNLFNELEQVPIDENRKLLADWRHFPKGTSKNEIWVWISDTFDITISSLLCGPPTK